MDNSFSATQFVKWLDALDKDLLTLYADHRLWWGLNRLVGQNLAIGTPGDLMNFITRSHFQAYLVGIRRVADQKCNGPSLWKLVHTVATAKIVFRREDYVSHYPEGLRGGAESNFDKIAGAGAGVFPSDRAVRDRLRIEELASVVKPIVDKTIAHRDMVSPDPPAIAQTCEILDEFMEMVERYRRLATGSSCRLRDCDPLSESDVDRPLRQAWIPEGSGFTFDTRWPIPSESKIP